MNLHGRRKLYTCYSQVTADNVITLLTQIVPVHTSNRADITYLEKYQRGIQPILNRVKEVRPEICNKIVVNRASEIVTFKTGYLMNRPVQYVSNTSSAEVSEKIDTINSMMLVAHKASEDKKLARWFHICGTAYRLVLPSPIGAVLPFEFYTIDPRLAFVVYSTGVGNKPMMGAVVSLNEDKKFVYDCYTPTEYFKIIEGMPSGFQMVEHKENPLGLIPVIEYPANEDRMGAFEPVIDLLDALNVVQSNRVDGIEQFVQALMLFHNVDISNNEFDALREKGGIKYSDIDPSMKAEIKYLISELNQTQTQVTVDDLYDTILTIVGMPNRNGGSSTSDTGSAVILRDGWQDAEARAQEVEGEFKRAERDFLSIILKILKTDRIVDVENKDIDIQFTRRNYENIASKAQVLTQMLANPKIHPLLAYQYSGMFADPDGAWVMSEKYYNETREQYNDAGANTDDTSNSQPGEHGGDKEAEE